MHRLDELAYFQELYGDFRGHELFMRRELERTNKERELTRSVHKRRSRNDRSVLHEHNIVQALRNSGKY